MIVGGRSFSENVIRNEQNHPPDQDQTKQLSVLLLVVGTVHGVGGGARVGRYKQLCARTWEGLREEHEPTQPASSNPICRNSASLNTTIKQQERFRAITQTGQTHSSIMPHPASRILSEAKKMGTKSVVYSPNSDIGVVTRTMELRKTKMTCHTFSSTKLRSVIP